MKFRYSMALPLLIVLIACSKNNNPDKWILFASSKSDERFYTRDKMSTSDTKLVKIWVKTVFNDPKRIEDKDIVYAKNMYMIKCTENRYKVNVGFNFTKDNEAASKTVIKQEDSAMPMIIDKSNKEFVFNSTTTVQDEYQPIIADSPAGRLHSIVCQ